MAPMKLTYFDISGVAEPIRWALEIGGQEWEDVRLSREDFAAVKPTLPNGQVPVLNVDGYQLAQSLAILRFVGRKAGLYPTDDLEAAKCDAVMDCCTDLAGHARPSLMEKDEEKKAAMRKELSAGYLPQWLSNMSKQLEESGGKYFASGKLTVADLAVVTRLTFITSMDHISPDIIAPYPALVALVKTVTEEPKIAAFIAKHAK